MMGVNIRYMGAKHRLSPLVAEKISTLQEGPCLDLFSGMCSVAGAISKSNRNVWCNDIQAYANIVAKVLTLRQETCSSSSDFIEILYPDYKKNLISLKEIFNNYLNQERTTLNSNNFEKYVNYMDEWKHVGNSSTYAKESEKFRNNQKAYPYKLNTITFSNGYFGLRQSIELDSIKFSIDQAYTKNKITLENWQLLNVALLQTASKIVNAPGHFAQYLTVKNKNTFSRIRAQRKRSPWNEFITQIDEILPYGTKTWRANNKVFNSEALELLDLLIESDEKPSIIYADPPYSSAQYSRYYHVLETLVKYDYPEANGKGRYRDDRFRTPFSLASKVHDAFEKLFSSTAQLDAALVLSYPSNGLLLKSGTNLVELMNRYFANVDVTEINSKHSTLGGAHGAMKSDVIEMIIIATNH